MDPSKVKKSFILLILFGIIIIILIQILIKPIVNNNYKINDEDNGTGYQKEGVPFVVKGKKMK